MWGHLFEYVGVNLFFYHNSGFGLNYFTTCCFQTDKLVGPIYDLFNHFELTLLQVHGIIRRSSSFNTGRIDHIYRDRHETGVKLFLHYGDLCDATNLITIIANVKPDEIYNLGAMSHVKVSFDMPEVSGEFNLF